MRRLAVLACSLACAEWRMPPTFPLQAAERPVVHEQALAGLSDGGDAAVLDLIDAEGEPPRLSLFVWGARGAPLAEAPPDRARAVAETIRRSGTRAAPLLAAAAAAQWPQGFATAAAAGYAASEPLPRKGSWEVEGAGAAGKLPLLLEASITAQPASVLVLRDGGSEEEVEVARMPLAGDAIEPQLWVRAGVAWFLAGSALPGEPLHRAIGLRRASLRRGEAQLHDLHGLADYGAGEIDSASREFDRAIAADPSYFDGLYNAAAAAALAGRGEQAIELLRKAAAIDAARVQVLGRNDEDFRSLRLRPEVRALFGTRRLPPEGLPPPP